MSANDTIAAQVDAWLQPVPGAERASGKELSDEDVREFRSMLAGRPETQFAEAVPPDFRKVVKQAEELLQRSRDLRVAVGWCRAVLRTQGISTLPDGLRLLQGLMAQFGEYLYPLADPDDGSYYARANALAELAETEGLLGDLRQSLLVSDRIQGEIRVRTVEIALTKLAPREDEAVMAPDQLKRFFSESPAGPALRAMLAEAKAQVKALISTAGEKIDAMDMPILVPLLGMLDNCITVLPAAADGAAVEGDATMDHADTGAAATASTAAALPRSSGPGEIHSRADVVRALDLICAYLEKAEPSNPAQMLLRRAKRLLDQNFLQLIQGLAPSALDDVAKLMGVDPASLTEGS